MEPQIIKIKSIEKVTHNVIQIVTEKPEHLTFTPGQAAEISINMTGWKDEKRPFTFTCLPENDFIEFTIKTYTDHKGVTNQLLQLKKDDELILHDIFGAIAYKGEGVFIAGGAGVTPFISIFRHLHSKNEILENKLIFANKTKEDVILEKEFKSLLGNNFMNILSDEKAEGYDYGHITGRYIESKSGGINKYFYICGPPLMMKSIEKQLSDLNVDKDCIVKESF